MNEEVKAYLLKYVAKLETAAEAGASFVAEQAPETVRQYLAWEFWSSAIWAAVFFSGVVAMLSFILSCYRWAKTEEGKKKIDEGHGEAFLRGVISIILLIICFPFSGTVAHHAAHAVKVRVAPNVVLIEKAAELAKQHKNY